VSDQHVEAKEEKGYYEPYTYFARILRTWFVAYGIGVPAFLMTSKSAEDPA
jgi:hypothetical protein